MHRAQRVADSVLSGITGAAIVSRQLQAREAAQLAASLNDDARDAIYSGTLSIAEAIQGLDRKLYTWATVKLYYSAFYLTRASLALGGVGIFYSRTTPYSWRATAGATPTKRAGTTHKVVLDTFSHHYTGSVLASQDIGADKPFDWLVDKREAANYKIPKFCEPTAPAHFAFVEQVGVRQLVQAYVLDETHLYTFDPDHAMLAFPIAALKLVLAQLRRSPSGSLGALDEAFLASQIFDRNGPLPELRKLLQP